MDIVVTGGIRMRSYFHLDGGGGWMRNFFLDIIQKVGKKKYKRGFEWCSGFGILGFEMLGNDQCDHMTFSDYYDVAIKDCLYTARKNGLSNKVNGYITGEIKTIPDWEKWDLVIANPPHDFGSIDESRQVHSAMEKSSMENMLRMISDEGMEIHKEFFTNIKKHLLPDADIFIYEPGVCVLSILDKLEFIRSCGIDLFSQYPVDSYLEACCDHNMIHLHKGGMLMHFKELK